MNIRRDLSGFDPIRGCVLTIGNFDGVHLGHQRMLKSVCSLGAQAGLPAVLLTFEPHPLELLAPPRAPVRLTRFREKMLRLAELESRLNSVLCLRFDKALALMPAEEFIHKVLVNGLGVRHLVVGRDFHFGHGGRGDVALLRKMAQDQGYILDCFDTVEQGDERVSSTRIRAALEAGDLVTAAQLLGRPYSVCGRISRGQQLGRQLGFPTANLIHSRYPCPLAGVFAVQTTMKQGSTHVGVANVGSRPTVSGTQKRVEVHLLDFNEDIYGQELKVEFLLRLRGERKFNGLAELTDQIRLDVQAGREFFALGT